MPVNKLKDAETDRAFFEQYPDREHRVRLTGEAEIARLEIASHELLQLPMGFRGFTLVRSESEALLEVFAINRGDVESDVPEDHAEGAFTTVETLLRRALQEMGGRP
jgi:hypothetical protein